VAYDLRTVHANAQFAQRGLSSYLDKAVHQWENENSEAKTARKAMENHLAIFPRYGMDCIAKM